MEPVDRRAAMRLRALWAVIGRFERLVGAEPLALAARRAELEAGERLTPRAAATRRAAPHHGAQRARRGGARSA